MANNQPTLVKKIFIKGYIEALTGLHIGGSNTSVEIGGVDTAIIRNPFNGEPYLPGSSVKGKMRSLLEQSYGVFGRGAGKVQFGPCDDEHHPIVKIFGSAAKNNTVPSKVIVRDCALVDDNDALLNNSNTDLPYTEVKTEIMVDRVTAVASPRQIERVPAGAKFNLDLVLNVWDTNTTSHIAEAEIVKMVFDGMRLLESDYLGGKGSRGSGQVKFNLTTIQERSNTFYTAGTNNELPYESSSHEIPADLAALKIA